MALDQEDHDLLLRIDERTKTLIESQNAFTMYMERQNDRICQLEACQNRWLGRDGVIVAGIGVAAGTVGAGLLWLLGVR